MTDITEKVARAIGTTKCDDATLADNLWNHFLTDYPDQSEQESVRKLIDGFISSAADAALSASGYRERETENEELREVVRRFMSMFALDSEDECREFAEQCGIENTYSLWELAQRANAVLDRDALSPKEGT